jgi:glutamate synthase domain-containing protein 2
VHNALVGAGVRDRIKLGASGKLVTAYDLCRVFAMGADYAMSARSFMFAVGCIQSRSCHTNHCPTGVATQDRLRQRALVVEDKAPRVANFHRNTLRALAELLGAAGLEHPDELKPWHLHIRHQSGAVMRGDDVYPHVEPGAILAGQISPELAREWERARADSFART